MSREMEGMKKASEWIKYEDEATSGAAVKKDRRDFLRKVSAN